MKRICAFLLILTLIFTLSGCSESSQPDYELLSKRMSEYNEHYAFEYFDMFQYDGAYHVYFSLCSEDDIMLSMTFDEENNISSVAVTAESAKMTTDGQRNAFKSFTSAVTNSFCTLSDKEKSELKNLSTENINLYFSDIYETYSALRYNFIFSSNSQYIVYFCEYVQVMEDLTQ
ncbi:MAG: hypothetical protein IJZ35_08230 [Clostridia bacterium]|nr:hypothetical protein [Clostridia bacterium]